MDPILWNALARQQRKVLGGGRLTALLRAHWPIPVYHYLSIVLAVIVGFRSGIGAALCTIAGAWFSTVGAGTLKSGFLWAARGPARLSAGLKGGPIIMGIVVLILAYSLGRGFSVILNGHVLSGEAWVIIGAAIGVVFTDRKQGDINQPRRSPSQPLPQAESKAGNFMRTG